MNLRDILYELRERAADDARDGPAGMTINHRGRLAYEWLSDNIGAFMTDRERTIENDDLVKRLHEYARGQGSGSWLAVTLHEAAERIADLEADAWQPIETAPKDRRIFLGRFSGDKKDEYDGYCAVDRWRFPTPGYHYTGWGQFNPTYWPPTHWREIRRPAAAEASDAKP